MGHDVPTPDSVLSSRPAPTRLPPDARDAVPPEARRRVVAAAEALLAGSWEVLYVPRPDIVDPDWFLDPVTGRRAPQDVLAFRVDHRNEMVTGNVKSVWELSRHHHLTVLASAWWLTGDDRFATVVDRQLRSWWHESPPLSGVHWTSGIELGVRLVSWAWIRRLMADWPAVSDLFESNPEALGQIWWHQRFLATFGSRGSSANNHAIAEQCGRLVAACAFPWFAESSQWRRDSATELRRHLRENTFASGVNKENATDYHRFVTELGLVAAVEAEAAGLDAGLWDLLARSLDVAAAILDCHGRPPRQGDGDEGRALVLDAPESDAWALLLGTGAVTVGEMGWWPAFQTGVIGAALGGLLGSPRPVAERIEARPSAFADAGMVLLRTPPDDRPEIWCRCDGGPHGFLSIAAHAHADALSIELRHGGVEILVDPGTYCYHGEPLWRSYFRSTIAHNTIEVDGINQSKEGGPFLWTSHAETVTEQHETAAERDIQTWAAHHTGYADAPGGVVHARQVSLDSERRELTVRDTVTSAGQHLLRLAFHLGPEVEVSLTGSRAGLSWVGDTGAVEGELDLPDTLSWTVHRGEETPPLGWYSPRFGVRTPTTVLIGFGQVADNRDLSTVVRFHDVPQAARQATMGGPDD